MTGRSGIGVLVAGFSRVGALKKHAPLVFIPDYFQVSMGDEPKAVGPLGVAFMKLQAAYTERRSKALSGN